MSKRRVVLYSPDRGQVYDGRTPDATGIGGGITARLSLLAALAAEGHDVTAYVNAAERLTHAGVRYVPLDQCSGIETDIFVAMSTGGDLSFRPLRGVSVQAALRIVWVQGVPQPADMEAVAPDFVYVASNFLRGVCLDRWGLPASKIFVCYNGLNQAAFEAAEARAIERDPLAIAYIGPPEKGLAASLEVLRRVRAIDARFHLDVFGGGRLWGRGDDAPPPEPGLQFHGLVGQAALVPRLFEYEYLLAPQSMEEGFGIAVQEAKRAGMIVIASGVGALTELVRHGQDGFLMAEPHESVACHDHMARLILRLSRDPDRRARIRANALMTPWSWTTAAQAWTSHWDHVLAGRSGSTRPSVVVGGLLDLPDGRHEEATGEFIPAGYPFSPLLEGRRPASRVLIAGYYGHRNLGDEVILHVMLEELRRAVPNLSATVVSGSPAETSRNHEVQAIHERDVPAIVEAAKAADLIVVGGGGLFHDYQGVDETTPLSRWHWGQSLYAGFAMLATVFRTPLFIAASGAGPLRTEAGRRYARLIFDRADAATVRDRASLDVLVGLGIDGNRIEVTADPAWTLRAPDRAEGRRHLAQLGVPDGSFVVAVALRSWDTGVSPGSWQGAVAAALDTLVDTLHAVPVFVPFQSAEESGPSDVAVAERIRDVMRHHRRAIVAPPDLDPHEVQGLLAGADVMLAMRLHGVLLAANATVPVVALAYDPKVAAAMDRLGQREFAVELSDLTAEAVADRVRRAGRDRDRIAAEIRIARDALRSAAARTWMAAVDLLANRSRAVRGPSPELVDLLHATLADQVKRAELSDAQAERLADDLTAAARETTRLADEREQLAARLVRQDAELTRGLAERDAARAAQAAAQHRAAELEALVGRIARTWVWRPLNWHWRSRSAAGRAIRRHVRLPLNPYEYVFDRYKRARAAAVGEHLAYLRTPGEPGLVSVVLPAFNGADYIREAVDSILAQTYQRFELIIVNDGSTDETPAIADDYARRDPRVRVVHQENRKLPRTLSEGMRRARGEYLTWTSCDNRMKPDCLARLVADLSAKPACDMVYANLDIIGGDGRFMRGAPEYGAYQRPPGSEHVYLPTRTTELNVWANNFVGAAFLYRRRVAWLLGDYSPHRFVSEDYDYWMRVNALLTLRHTSFAQPVYDYRFHSGSLTARWEELGMLRHRERLMVFEEFRRDFCLAPMLWVVDGDDEALMADVEARVRAAGHLVYRRQFPLDQVPSLWVPVVHVRAAASPSRPGDPRTDLPPSALSVLVTRGADLPAAMPVAWQLCVSTAVTAPLPELARFAQGWLGAIDVAQAFQAIDVRARSHHLALIESLVEAPPEPSLKASVIICTHRSGDRVRRAILSVLDQSVPASQYEVIVVNNAPSRPELARAVQTLREERRRDRPDHLRLVACPILGLSAARNAGLADARGELVCLLDDDAVADPEWLERLIAAFDAHPQAGVIGGHIRLRIPDPQPPGFKHGWEKYWSQFITRFRGYTEVSRWWEFPWGANWSARRAALLAIGGFRLQYGRVGDNFWGGEEVVASALVQRLGWHIAILPEAGVLHDVDPSRFTTTHVRRTLVAGHCVAYLGQRDLYIPMESGVRTTLKLLIGTYFDRGVAGWRNRAVDVALRKYAQIRLLLLQLADVGRRLRRPAVAGGPAGRGAPIARSLDGR